MARNTMRILPLTAGMAVVASMTVVALLSSTSPALAAFCGGTQGQALLLGCNHNLATDYTEITSSGDGLLVLAEGAGSTGLFGSGGTVGVQGTGGTYGVTGSGTTYGVQGDVSATGGANGVYGHASNSGGSGVYGQNDGAGYGMAGRAPNGTGVLADSASGTALQVTGKAVFSRSGKATVPSGAKKIVVNMSGVTTSSMVLATVQQSGAFYVKNVVPASGAFTIFINKAPASPATVKVAYFVLN